MDGIGRMKFRNEWCGNCWEHCGCFYDLAYFFTLVSCYMCCIKFHCWKTGLASDTEWADYGGK